MRDESNLHRIRCDDCDARLFDTSGAIADESGDSIEVLVKCWRCKSLCVVYLAGPDAAVEGVLHYPT